MTARLETTIVVVAFLCWLIGLVAWVGLLPLAGSFDLGLRVLFAVAAGLGWLAGNVYVQRSRGRSAVARPRLLVTYLLGPPGLLFLVRAMASTELQATAPLAPLYASGVYAILFFVPVSLRRAFRRPA